MTLYLAGWYSLELWNYSNYDIIPFYKGNLIDVATKTAPHPTPPGCYWNERLAGKEVKKLNLRNNGTAARGPCSFSCALSKLESLSVNKADGLWLWGGIRGSLSFSWAFCLKAAPATRSLQLSNSTVHVPLIHANGISIRQQLQTPLCGLQSFDFQSQFTLYFNWDGFLGLGMAFTMIFNLLISSYFPATLEILHRRVESTFQPWVQNWCSETEIDIFINESDLSFMTRMDHS